MVEGKIVFDYIVNNTRFIPGEVDTRHKFSVFCHINNSGTIDLLLHIAQCWCAEFTDDRGSLVGSLYCAKEMILYYMKKGFYITEGIILIKFCPTSTRLYRSSSRITCMLRPWLMVQ